MVFVLFCLISQVWTQNNTMERRMEMKETDYTHRSQKTEVRHSTQEATWEDAQGVGSTKQVGSREKKRGEGEPIGKCLNWGSEGWSKAKGVREFHWCIWMSLGHSREGEKGLALSHMCTWLPGHGTHSLLVGMLRHQENMKFLKVIMQLILWCLNIINNSNWDG